MSVVIEDRMDFPRRWNRFVDLIQKTQKFLMPMARLTLCDKVPSRTLKAAHRVVGRAADNRALSLNLCGVGMGIVDPGKNPISLVRMIKKKQTSVLIAQCRLSLRVSEIVGLKWESFDFDAGTVLVQRSAVANGFWETQKPAGTG